MAQLPKYKISLWYSQCCLKILLVQGPIVSENSLGRDWQQLDFFEGEILEHQSGSDVTQMN